jgi:hypothetical protein
MEEKNELTPQPPEAKPAELAVNKLLSAIGTDKIVVSTKCCLCNSKFRKEIDEMCEAKKTLNDIRKFLEEKGEHAPSLSNIAHHINEHFKKQANLAILADYYQNLVALSSCRQNRFDSLNTMLDMGFLDLAKALSIPTTNDLMKEKEKNDIVLKIRKDIRETIAALNEMDSVDAQVKTYKMNFIQAFKTRIDTAKSEQEKQVYILALQQFRDLIGDK